MTGYSLRRVLSGIALVAIALPSCLNAADVNDTALTSEVMPLATTRSLVLDIAESDQRAVMVGERGQIFVSESRSDWRQLANVPTRSTLTAVAAVGDKVWAVGHDGVIIHSDDGGLTWVVQRNDPWHPVADDAEFDPRQGVPLLDIAMFDAEHGIAVGAYSLMLKTVDGGATWEPVRVSPPVSESEPEGGAVDEEVLSDEEVDWTFSDEDLALDDEVDPHLNGITRTGDGSLLIVGERGAVFRSTDQGITWERSALPYEGSMFGVVGYDGQRVIAYGMRGNVFESVDLGTTWTALDSGTNQTLMGGAALDNGGVVLVGGSGAVIVQDSPGAAFVAYAFETSEHETPVLAAVLPLAKNTFIVGGEKGVGRFQPQSKSGE